MVLNPLPVSESPFAWAWSHKDEYEVKNGRIVTPGKFQGEEHWVPYFWQLAREGWADTTYTRDGITIYTFDIACGDREVFPSLQGKLALSVVEGESGFVYGAAR